MGFLDTIISFIERLVRLFIGANEEKLYGLDHAILNVEVPPRNMWMNMGYWKVCIPLVFMSDLLTE